DLALALDQLGQLANKRGDLEEAENLFRRGLEIRQATLAPTNSKLLYSHVNIGRVAYSRGDAEGALAAWEQGLALAKGSLDDSHPELARAETNVGVALRALGRLDEAEVHYRRALEIYERSLGLEHGDTVIAQYNLGNLLTQRDDYVEARAVQEAAIATWEKTLGPDSEMIAHGSLALTFTLVGLEDYAAAHEQAARALRVLTGLAVDKPALRLQAESLLASCELELDQRALARDRAERVLAEFADMEADLDGVSKRRLAQLRLDLADLLPRSERARSAELREQVRKQFPAMLDGD
ncbi:MAG: tetratricopeptide repeat protein, partial [Myxococcales bacterium]|nr:tetratricopeptide repeat protein [Myxococcales bacterium]